jgi:hypothetical protein
MPSIARALNRIARDMDEAMSHREEIMTRDAALRLALIDRSLGAASMGWPNDYIFFDEDGDRWYYNRTTGEARPSLRTDVDRAQGDDWKIVRRTDTLPSKPQEPINAGHPRQCMVRRKDQICEE